MLTSSADAPEEPITRDHASCAACISSLTCSSWSESSSRAVRYAFAVSRVDDVLGAPEGAGDPAFVSPSALASEAAGAGVRAEAPNVKPSVVVGNATGAAAANLKPPVKGATPGAAADSGAPNVKLPVLEATAATGEQKVKPELEVEPAAGDGAAAVAGARAGASPAACIAANSHAKRFACSHGFGT
jgi:hypothetical protein